MPFRFSFEVKYQVKGAEQISDRSIVVVEPRILDLDQVDEVGETGLFEVTITNHGFIAVEDIDLGFDDHPLYDIEVPDGALALLEGKSSITIPVTITKTATLEEYTEGYYDSRGIDPDGDGEAGFFDGALGSVEPNSEAVAETGTFSAFASFASTQSARQSDGGLDPANYPTPPGSIPCQTGGGVSYTYECGPHTNNKWVAIEIINPEGDCGPGGPGGVGGGAGGGGGGGGGFGGGGGGGGGGFGGFGTASGSGGPSSSASVPPTTPPTDACEVEPPKTWAEIKQCLRENFEDSMGTGDSLSNILSGSTFGDAALTVWDLKSTAEVPIPASFYLMLVGFGSLGFLSRKRIA